MTTLLRLDASARRDGSLSRTLGDHFVAQWQRHNPAGSIVVRDLALEPIEAIRQTTIAAFYTPAEKFTSETREATALSDRLIRELQEASEVVITVPMYNFGVPSALKAWIDQIVRIGHTFSYDGTTFRGLLTAKRSTVLCAYGANGYLDGGPFAAADFVKPYLGFLLQFLGIADVRFSVVEATTADAATVDAALARAKGEIERLLSNQ